MGALQDLPDYVQILLQPLPVELKGKCVDAGEILVVMVPGLFHITLYHMLLYFVRHIVQGVLQAWGTEAFQELGFVLISHPHQGSMPGNIINLVHFRIAEVFLLGGDMVDQMRASGQTCLHFEEVLIMQAGPFWPGLLVWACQHSGRSLWVWDAQRHPAVAPVTAACKALLRRLKGSST